MSTLNFPSSPSVGQTHTVGNKTYIWTGSAWIVYTTNNITSGEVSITSSTNSISTVTGALTVTGGAGIGGDLYVGGTIYGTISGNIEGIATTASTVVTVEQTSVNNHYLTFVDSNNPTPTSENLYTTNSFIVVPSTGNVGLGITPDSKLHVSGDVKITGITTVTNTTNATSTTTGALQVTGGVGIGGDVWIERRLNSESVKIADSVFDSTTISLSTNATSVIDTYSLLEFRAAKYFIQISDDGPPEEYQAQEITIIANTTTAFISEYGLVTTNGPSGLGSFDAIVDGTDVKLRFTPDFSTNKTVKVLRTAMSI